LSRPPSEPDLSSRRLVPPALGFARFARVSRELRASSGWGPENFWAQLGLRFSGTGGVVFQNLGFVCRCAIKSVHLSEVAQEDPYMLSTQAVAAPDAPLPEAKTKYDPPTFIPSQLKTLTMQRKAWMKVLSDVADTKNKDAFIAWVPEWMNTNMAEIRKQYSPSAPAESIVKDIIDSVVKKSPEQRLSWYTGYLTAVRRELLGATKWFSNWSPGLLFGAK